MNVSLHTASATKHVIQTGNSQPQLQLGPKNTGAQKLGVTVTSQMIDLLIP